MSSLAREGAEEAASLADDVVGEARAVLRRLRGG
jgi:hypothetical protein